jgi:poly(A) polymerase
MVSPKFDKEILSLVRECKPAESNVYIIGGAVRDALVSRQIHDYDFGINGDAEKLGRCVANKTKGDFFMLDDKRSTCRVLLHISKNERKTLDFAILTGNNVKEDLCQRDFTINALAVDVDDTAKIIDPLGGVRDLQDGKLRPCNETSFISDPVRVLRAVRFQAQDHFLLSDGSISELKKAVAFLSHVSPERKRDELFRITEGSGFLPALRMMADLHIFHHFLEPLNDLRGNATGAENQPDLWDHTLKVVEAMKSLLGYFLTEATEKLKGSYRKIDTGLRRYRIPVQNHLLRKIHTERRKSSLLLLAALFHEVGKPDCIERDWDGFLHYYRYETVSANIAREIGQSLALSKREISILERTIQNQTFIQNSLPLIKEEAREQVYDLFQRVGESGIECCLLSLAREISSESLKESDKLEEVIEAVAKYLNAWLFHRQEMIDPQRLLSGDEVIRLVHGKPGPRVGYLLKSLRRAQATGKIRSKEEAQDFILQLERTNFSTNHGFTG